MDSRMNAMSCCFDRVCSLLRGDVHRFFVERTDSPQRVEMWCETALGEVVKTSHLHLFRRGKTRQELIWPHNFSCIFTVWVGNPVKMQEKLCGLS